MKRSFILIWALLGSLGLLNAQENCGINYGKFDDAGSVQLYGDKVNVRSTASTTGAIVANLPVGSAVNVLVGKEEVFTMNGYTTNWYEVSFNDQGISKTGYIWGGLISLASVAIPNPGHSDDLFVVGISSWSQEKDFTTTARIVRDGKIFASLEFEPITSGFFDPGVFGHSVCVSLEGGHGFKGIRNVVRLSFTYEACGYSNGEVIFFWDGTKLTYVATPIRVSEAGIFHYDYECIFPDNKEGGVPNTLKIINSGVEYFEVGEESEGPVEIPEGFRKNEDGIYVKKEVFLKKFVWDGTRVNEYPDEPLPE